MPDPKNIPFKKLEKLVFTYDSSKADNRYFRMQLMEYINTGQKQDFRQYLWDHLYIRNGNGQTSKYLHFNERNQKLYIDRLFLEWATRTLRHIQTEISENDSLQKDDKNKVGLGTE